MINLLLEALISKSKIERVKIKDNLLYIIVMIVSILAIIIPPFIFPLMFTSLWGLILFVPIVIFFVNFKLWEIKNQKIYKERLTEHNKLLNEVREILQTDFKYSTDMGNEKNWYSENKIKYLISSCESYIEEQKKNNIKLVELSKTIILPIIAFVAGVFSENSSINDALILAFIALFVVVIVYSIGKILSFVIDLVLKSSSIAEMKRLLFLLKELLARDF